MFGGGKIIIYIYKLFYIIDIFLFNNNKTQLLILKGGPWGGLAYIYYIYQYIYIYYIYQILYSIYDLSILYINTLYTIYYML